MREIIETLTGGVSVAGYEISIVALVGIGALAIGLVSRNLWFSILGVFLLFFFYLLLPAIRY